MFWPRNYGPDSAAAQPSHGDSANVCSLSKTSVTILPTDAFPRMVASYSERMSACDHIHN